MKLLVWIIPIVSVAGNPASVPVRDACSPDGSILASVQQGDRIQVRHAVVGEATACYAVSVVQAGNEVHGFILDSTLPAIQEFERKRALESRVPLADAPAAAPAAPEKVVLPPVAPAFEPWAGADIKGRRLQISGTDAKVTLVTLYAIQSGTARRLVEGLRKTESEFRANGLRSFGMIEAASKEKADYYLEDMGIDAPQAFDRQGLAAKYKADIAKGTTLVVDSSNNVVAVSSNPAEIRAVVARLLSSK